MRLALALVLLACGPSPVSAPRDASEPPQARSESEEDAGAEDKPSSPCGRIETLRYDGGALQAPLPCRPFNRLTDTPYPQP